MTFNRYYSEYPNQVHQLSVSVSKHIYANRTGQLKFQKKPFDFDLANVRTADRTHVLHYLIRDHFSGAFYAEICASDAIAPVQDFLIRAWSIKREYLFCGVPDHISIPKTVASSFASICSFVQSLGVEPHEPTSGFHAGVRDIKTWEEYVRWNIQVEEDWRTLESARSKTIELVVDLNGPASDFSSKIGKWSRLVKGIRDPSGKRFRITLNSTDDD